MAGASRRTGRPGSADTAMQAWILAQPPAKIGAALHERFARSYEEGSLINSRAIRPFAHATPGHRRYRRDLERQHQPT
jgi:hypothetical protein